PAWRAGQAGIAVAEVIEAGTAGPSKDALLIYRMPGGAPLSEADADGISDASLDELYRQLLAMRRARIAHGAISGESVVVDPAGQPPALAGLRYAPTSASPDQLDRT